MDAVAKLAGVMFFVALLILTMPMLGVLFGMFSGWVVGLFFEDMIVGFLRRLGADTAGLRLWQIGGAMGFFGGFLKTSVSSKSK
jgi:hypothetical protein